MNSTLSGIAAALVMASIPDVSGAKLPEVCEGIALHDNSGSIYVISQSEADLAVAVDKTEPEGIFRYYDEVFSGNKNEKSVYRMDLSCCEYLIDSGEYASRYTVTMNIPGRYNAEYSQDILIKDPGFEDVERTEYYFYVTSVVADKSGWELLGSNEYTTEDGVQICEQYVTIRYTDKLTGDVNGDGEINIADAGKILECYAKASAGFEVDADVAAADIDGNGKVEISDATAVLSYYARNAAGISTSWRDILN